MKLREDKGYHSDYLWLEKLETTYLWLELKKSVFLQFKFLNLFLCIYLFFYYINFVKINNWKDNEYN